MLEPAATAPFRRAKKHHRAAHYGLALVMVLIGVSCAASSETSSSPVPFDSFTVIVDTSGEASVVGNVTGAVEQVTVDWGDGEVSAVATGFPGVQVSHPYAADGTYSIVVVATGADGATTNQVLTAEVVGVSPTTNPNSTTLPESTTTIAPTSTISTTSTTVAPTTTTPPTTAAPATTPPTTAAPATTTTTTPPPAPIILDLTRPTGGGGDTEGRTNLPFRLNVASWWTTGNLHARAAVGPGSFGQTPWAEAWLYSDFTAQREQATLRYTVSWDGTLDSFTSLGARTAVTIAVSVHELDGSRQGSRLKRDVVLDEEINTEEIKVVTSLTYTDSLSSALSFPVQAGKQYRVRLDLRCEATATVAVGATACSFGSNSVADEGLFARWSDVTVTFD